MACSDYYTGCSQVVSDKCVKYTGVDVPVMDIKKGDSLSYVEQAPATFLAGTLDGSGIKITIDDDSYCRSVSHYLQECCSVTAIALFKSLVQPACNLLIQVDEVVA